MTLARKMFSLLPQEPLYTYKKEREKQIRISLRLSPAEENGLRVYIYAWRPSYLEWVWRWEAWASASSPLHFQQMVLSLSHVTSKKGRLQPSPTDCVCSLPHRSRVCMRQKAFVFTSLADVCLFFFFHFSLASAPEHFKQASLAVCSLWNWVLKKENSFDHQGSEGAATPSLSPRFRKTGLCCQIQTMTGGI